MQQAPHLETLIARLYEAMAHGDDATLAQIFAQQPETLVIGTDPTEWWEGGASFVDAMRRRMQEMGDGIPVIASNPRAYMEGEIGWAADRGLYRLPGGAEQPFRSSFTFRREADAWRLLQWHVSFPVTNDEVLRRAGA